MLYEAEKYCLECKAFGAMTKFKTDTFFCRKCYTIGDGQHPLDKKHVAPPTERLGPKQKGFMKSPHRTRIWATCVRSRSATMMRYRKQREV